MTMLSSFLGILLFRFLHSLFQLATLPSLVVGVVVVIVSLYTEQE